MIYGLERDLTEYERFHNTRREIVEEIEVASVGNVILRIGRENRSGCGWTQIAHVVLTPDEARRLGHEILDQAGAGLERERARNPIG